MTQHPTPILDHAVRVRQLADARRLILSEPADQVMAAILNHPQPAALVHSFPEEDLHFLIHDIGPDDALPLIALASNRQWEYLLDMEAWSRDRLNYRQTTAWLQLLLQADPDRLVKWCYDEKLEFLEMVLFRNIQVQIRESDQFPSDLGDGFFTDDDTYYVRFVDYPVATEEEETVKTLRNEVLGELLRRLSLFDHPRYQGLLLEAMSVIPGETEEELFRLRNVRLAEKGFLPFHEAVGVYQPLRPGDLSARGKKVLRPPSHADSRFPVPQFAATFLDGDNLFVRALKGIRQVHLLQQLQVELAGLCNQVISADQEAIRGRDQLKSVVSKVSGYLGIGLEVMTENTDGSPEIKASELLQRHLLSDVFRTGFAGALQLKWQAASWRKKSWFQAQPVDLSFWDEAWMGLLGGLLIDTPKFYDPSSAGSSYRDFQTQDEIKTTGLHLDRVIGVDELLNDMDVPMAPVAGVLFLTYKNLLLTLWARASLNMPAIDQDTETVSVSLSVFRDFYASLWTIQEGKRVIGDEKRAEFLQWASQASGRQPVELSDRLGAVFQALFDEMEREMAPVRTGNLDPHHVRLFLIKP